MAQACRVADGLASSTLAAIIMKNGAVSEAKPQLPASVTHFGINVIGLACLLGTLFVLRGMSWSLQDDVLAILAAVAVPIVALDVLVLKVHRRASTGLDWDRVFSPDYTRIGTKLLGLAVTVGLIAFAYWQLPEYHGAFYDPFYRILRRIWPPLAVATPAYVILVDGIMIQPRDAYWQIGRAVLGRTGDVKGAEVANHFRGWLVKAFFLPLMMVWMHGQMKSLIHFDFAAIDWSNLKLYDFFYEIIFGVDLILATAGYALSFRVIDTHIRSAEPTMLGWAVALFCYQPFYSLMETQFVRYSSDFGFGAWLAAWPTMRWVWAGTIVFLIGTYSLATVAFGVRFSNLTHRGILTNGPYRFTKHPAYVTKNLSWWLVSIPFIPHSGALDAVHHCIALGCVNTMYFLRARTEERHLSRDPTYVAYALWMNEHGALRFLGRLIPALRYKAPPTTPETPPPVTATTPAADAATAE
jgi:protein-S-isoprenylcysteine O-methyltransferase Ste14